MPTQSLHNEMEEKGTRKAFDSEFIKHWDTFLPFLHCVYGEEASSCLHND